MVIEGNKGRDGLPDSQVNRVQEVETLRRGGDVGESQALVDRQVVHLVHHQTREPPIIPRDDPIKLFLQHVSAEVRHSPVQDVGLVGDPPGLPVLGGGEVGGGESEVFVQLPPLPRVPLRKDGGGAGDVNLPASTDQGLDGGKGRDDESLALTSGELQQPTSRLRTLMILPTRLRKSTSILNVFISNLKNKAANSYKLIESQFKAPGLGNPDLNKL